VSQTFEGKSKIHKLSHMYMDIEPQYVCTTEKATFSPMESFPLAQSLVLEIPCLLHDQLQTGVNGIVNGDGALLASQNLC